MAGRVQRSVPTSNWMRRWLMAAGAYNITWGAAMALAPIQTLALLGVSPPSVDVWPQLWACIGMIVGVYGIGYVIAARDPERHWPIVLVGLLGKVLGPIGFIDAAARGLLPWSMGATLLTNDLLWWVPFSMILWHAARAAQPALPDGVVTLDEALDRVRDDQGQTLRALTDGRESLVVLLRHSGCTFCQQTLADLASRQGDLERANVGLVVVGMGSSTDRLRELGRKHGLLNAAWVADPQRLVYRAMELGRGSFLQLFGPSVWLRGVLAAVRGHGIGALEGDGFQMPGAFLIHRGRVLRAYRHRTAADRPDYKELACSINSPP